MVNGLVQCVSPMLELAHSFLANSSPTPALANKPAQPRLNKRRMAGRENQWLKKLPA